MCAGPHRRCGVEIAVEEIAGTIKIIVRISKNLAVEYLVQIIRERL